jgi:8-oxo-dGTP pyrophosphatase MutT (NUDIX family)
MPDRETADPSLEDVRRALSHPLPGIRAQLKMAPQPRPGRDLDLGVPAGCRESSVLILLYPRAGRLYFVLTRRTEMVQSHKGQISLPGGAREGGESLAKTALRETCEELGVPQNDTEVLGCLSTIYIPHSNYCIYPFVAYRPDPPVFYADPVEVAEVLEVPLALLFDPSIRRVEYWSAPDFDSPRRVPFFSIHGQVVWGATAMILSELVSVLDREIEWEDSQEEGGTNA